MRIRMLKSTVCGGERVSAGKIVDANDKDARFLVASGMAVKEEEKPRPKSKKSPVNRMAEVSETRDAG